MTVQKILTTNVKALFVKGVDVNILRGQNTTTGRIYKNNGYMVWLLKNEGFRINGRFAKKVA